jgi:hypothetical protein
MVAVTRLGHDPANRAYMERRLAEGKTKREIIRCLKRYISRRVWRLLEHAPPANSPHYCGAVTDQGLSLSDECAIHSRTVQVALAFCRETEHAL